MRAIPIAVAFALIASGCTELATTGSADIAGVAGGAVAGALTSNPAVAAAAVLSAQSGARAGMNYAQRQVHTAAQDQIAQAAGDLKIGQVAAWSTRDRLIERGQQGRVTVSRLISTTGLHCKEIIFSVDTAAENAPPRSAFYMSAICRDGARWKWASAEPATERWGALQ